MARTSYFSMRWWYVFCNFRCIFVLQTQQSIKHSLMFTYIWYYSFHTLLSIFQSVDHQRWYLKDCHPLHLNRTIVPKRYLRNQTMSMKMKRMLLFNIYIYKYIVYGGVSLIQLVLLRCVATSLKYLRF
jgi:hypothetical protein